MIPKPVSRATRIYRYEHELKQSLRSQLELVEPGLVAVDDGRERIVATGKIDITARDANGNYVVIELKAGPCPRGALEQVLGYSHDLETETGVKCRALIVASEFPHRLRAAVQRCPNAQLVTYCVSALDFEEELLQPHKMQSDREEHLPPPQS